MDDEIEITYSSSVIKMINLVALMSIVVFSLILMAIPYLNYCYRQIAILGFYTTGLELFGLLCSFTATSIGIAGGFAVFLILIMLFTIVPELAKRIGKLAPLLKLGKRK